MTPMNSSHEIFVFGDEPLPCAIGVLEDSVFTRIEGFGDVTESGSGASGWNLDIEFDSPGAFIVIIHAVLESLHECQIDVQSVTASVRGRRHKLVDLL
jgi:hypothetical protein